MHFSKVSSHPLLKNKQTKAKYHEHLPFCWYFNVQVYIRKHIHYNVQEYNAFVPINIITVLTPFNTKHWWRSTLQTLDIKYKYLYQEDQLCLCFSDFSIIFWNCSDKLSDFASVFHLFASFTNKHFNDSTWHKLKEHSLLLTRIKINLDNDHIFVNIISILVSSCTQVSR